MESEREAVGPSEIWIWTGPRTQCQEVEQEICFQDVGGFGTLKVLSESAPRLGLCTVHDSIE